MGWTWNEIKNQKMNFVDHHDMLKTFDIGQPLYTCHILWTIFLDPALLEDDNQYMVLKVSQYIARLPLFAIRWMEKGLLNDFVVPEQEIIPLDYNEFEDTPFIDTLSTNVFKPNIMNNWRYVSEIKRLVGPLDTQYALPNLREGLVEDFNIILNTLQHFLTTWACTNTNFEVVEPVFLVMSILYEINSLLQLVPPTSFYNDTISDVMDVKQHFPKWKLNDGFSLCRYPFLLTISAKSDILRIESMVQMRHELQDAFFRAMFVGVNSPYLNLEIRRDQLIRDTLYQLECKHPSDLKKQLRVTFQGETGLDDGGLQKELYRLIIRDMFCEDYGLFRYYQDTRLWWFALDSTIDDDCLKEYKLVGQLIGIAIYNGIILDLSFPLALYKKLMQEEINLSDLALLDPQLATSLTSVIEMKNSHDLGLAFEIEIPSFGHVHHAELCENGRNIKVRDDNKHLYVEMYVEYYLHRSIARPFASFLEGFQSVTKSTALVLFTSAELEELICGQPELNFKELQKVTKYDGGYTETSDVIKWFWEIIDLFNLEDKKKLLQFTTSSDRVPTGGFNKLTFVIVKNGGDTDRVPTAHTCFNVLLLPEYVSKEKLESKLMTAIRNGEGFGLL